MAVQQNKKSRSRKGMRRSHDRVATPTVIYCSCGEPTVPHSVCPNCGAKLEFDLSDLANALNEAAEEDDE